MFTVSESALLQERVNVGIALRGAQLGSGIR